MPGRRDLLEAWGYRQFDVMDLRANRVPRRVHIVRGGGERGENPWPWSAFGSFGALFLVGAFGFLVGFLFGCGLLFGWHVVSPVSE